MSDSGDGTSESIISGPWPSESEIEFERRLLNIEQHQARTNQLLMQLQLEYRKGMILLSERVDHLAVTVSTQMGELTGLMKKFLANGH